MLASVKLVCWLAEGFRRCCCLLFCWGLFVIFVMGAAVNDGLGMQVFISLIVVAVVCGRFCFFVCFIYFVCLFCDGCRSK